jgi:hypothetical protein
MWAKTGIIALGCAPSSCGCNSAHFCLHELNRRNQKWFTKTLVQCISAYQELHVGKDWHHCTAMRTFFLQMQHCTLLPA